MRKFYTGIVNHRKMMIVLFLIGFCISLVCSQMVSVNYDITDYLPENTKSTVSLDTMSEEFEGGIPNARVMIRNVTIPEALEYKEELKTVEGVTAVTWLDDATDITVPFSTLDEDVVETYYKDNTALFTVTIEEDYRLSATEEIRAIIGEENAMTGSAISTATATINTVSEVLKITVIAVIFVLLILILTTTSWVEPFIVLIGLGVAIMLNNGSNLIFGEISFVTNAAGSVLQLAVSLDYSVFLLHRFEECRAENTDAKDAMIDALCKSTSSILSSGLTTVIGFLALVLMQFRLGADLGLALAKGVAISLITVFIFMPSLILCTYKWLDKTKHKSFMPSFRGFGKVVQKITIPMACIFAILIIPTYLASNANSYWYGSSEIFGEDIQYGKDTAAIEEVFGKSDTYVLMVPKGDTATETALSEELHTLPEITSIISYVDMAGAEVPYAYLDEDTLSQLQGDRYSRMVITVDVPYEGEETFTLVENIRSIAEKYYPDNTFLAGEGVSTYDLKETVTADMIKVNLLAIGAVFVVLLLTLKSISLPFILVLSIETAIWLNLSIPYFMDKPIFYLAYLIISSVQLGATVDYAILMTDRYKENTPKEEVVYINLNADGSVKEINVVNIFDLDADGRIVDYGKYESLRNMTTTDAIDYTGDTVTIDAGAGKLYYEGKLDSNVMPWKIAIHYYMDDKEYTAEEIAGKSGDLEITMKITENTGYTGNFFEGYALQASVTLDTKKCSNIQADGATVANVGSDKLLTYTILPNKGADIEITADVTDFEMSAIAINGVKLNLAFEIDDSEIQSKIDEIIGAVNDLDDGADELKDGASDLYDGTTLLCEKVGDLYSGVGVLNGGASDLSDGLSSIVSKNEELLNGAYTAFKGLCTAAETSLNAELTANGLQTVTLTPETYAAVLTGLLETMNADSVYNTAYNQALAEVTTQVEAQADVLYAGYIDSNADAIYLSYIQSQADTLYAQVAAQAVLEQLIADGRSKEEAAAYLQTEEGQVLITQAVSAMTDEQKQQMIAIAVGSLTDEQKAQIKAGAVASLTEEQKAQIRNGYIDQTMKSEEVTGQITAAVAAAGTSAAKVAELKGQLDNYSVFYDGLKSYTSAVSGAANGANTLKINMNTLYTNVGTLQSSVGELNDGAKTLFDGTVELKDGTEEFVEQTDGMDTEVSDEIESMISDVSGSEVEITSFVSEKNTNVEAVQFVIQTEAVEITEEADTEPEEEESLSFLEKLLNLF